MIKIFERRNAMKKEDLRAIGLTEEQEQKVLALFDEIKEENKNLKQSVEEGEKQLADLKKTSHENAELQKQIETLQQQNITQKKTYETEMSALKFDNAMELSLMGAKAKNAKAVRAMLDESKMQLGEDGVLTGFKEQIEALQKSDSYLFHMEQLAQQQFTGFQPGVSTTIPNSMAAGYEARLADARKNKNQLEVIKIKQQAAADGVILI